MKTVIRVQRADFDVAVEYAALCAGTAAEGVDPGVGAVTIFVGRVRDGSPPGGASAAAAGGAAEAPPTPTATAVRHMYLEHYPAMTEKALAEIVSEAATRWPLAAVHIVHRVGALAPGDQIVFVGTASAHRAAAFAACEFLIDWLKTRAPFWKCETDVAGASRWVEQQASDLSRAERWASSPAKKPGHDG